MYGTFYAVGVGPGDPELMTLQAVRILQEADWIAVAGAAPKAAVAYQIAVQAVPALAEKPLLAVEMPMIHDQDALRTAHQAAVEALQERLRTGQSVAFLTLGDPTIYATSAYLQQLLAADGFPAEFVSGVPSFCAAAARAGMPLVSWKEALHVIPAVHRSSDPAPDADSADTYVFLKAGKHLDALREAFPEDAYALTFVENCGLDQERICRDRSEFPTCAGYYSLVLAKPLQQNE